MEGVRVIGKIWTNCSFPSGHVAASTAVLAALFYLFKKFRKEWLIFLAAIFILFLAFARIYVGMHYPSDVLGGIIVGSISSFLVIRLDKHIKFSN
jgi:undecaprenyl-diphosphatase